MRLIVRSVAAPIPATETQRRGGAGPCPARPKAYLLACVTVLGALTLALPASAQLQRADQAYEAGELATAGRAYEDAVEAGGLEPDALGRAHLRLAILATLGDDLPRFEEHARIALALNPQADAGPLSEPWQARFEEVRRSCDGASLRVFLEVGDLEAPLGVLVRGAPDGLVRTLTVRGVNGWTRSLAWEGQRLEVHAPLEARPVEVDALDRFGNVAGRAGIPPPRPAEPASPSPPTPNLEEDSTPLIESPWLWVAVGLVVAGVALAVGLTATGERYILDAPVIR